MAELEFQVEPRTPGKAGARAARRAGNVPCVLYGHHVEAQAFTTSEKSLLPLIYTNRTHVVTLNMGAKSWECILKDVDFHPLTDRPMHADFQVLQPGEKVTLSVPLRFVGTSIGQARGGLARHRIHDLEVSCFPRHIPEHIEVEVEHVDIGESIHVADLSLENLDILAPGDQILMTVIRPRAAVVESEEEEIEEEPLEE